MRGQAKSTSHKMKAIAVIPYRPTNQQTPYLAYIDKYDLIIDKLINLRARRYDQTKENYIYSIKRSCAFLYAHIYM